MSSVSILAILTHFLNETLRAKYGGVYIKYFEELNLSFVWTSNAATCSVQVWKDDFFGFWYATLSKGWQKVFQTVSELTERNMRKRLYLCSIFGGLFGM